MARTWHWLGAVRRTFVNSSCKSVAILDHTSLIHTAPLEEETAISAAPAAATSQTARSEGENDRKTSKKVVLTIEDVAAIKIQACFRGHLVCVCDPLSIYHYAVMCILETCICACNAG